MGRHKSGVLGRMLHRCLPIFIGPVNPECFRALIRNLGPDQRNDGNQRGVLQKDGVEWLCLGTTISKSRTELLLQDLVI